MEHEIDSGPKDLAREERAAQLQDEMNEYLKNSAQHHYKEIEDDLPSQIERLSETTEQALKESYGISLSIRDKRMVREVVEEILEHYKNDYKGVRDGKFDPQGSFSALMAPESEACVLFIKKRFGLSPNQYSAESDAMIKFFGELQEKEHPLG